MITKRIIPCLDVRDGRVVKGVNFQKLGDVASPVELAKYYSDNGADELVFYDITASAEGRALFTDILTETARTVFIPLTVGGGIRNMETVDTYLKAGLDRVILGTAAVEDRGFLKKTVEKYGEKIAVGVDVRDGFVAVKGWTENSALRFMDFCKEMEETGVKTLICTDISRDGAMRGTNREMYRELSETLGLKITASGGVSTLEDVESLRKMNLYGAIIGKAYYTGDINLKKAIETAR